MTSILVNKTKLGEGREGDKERERQRDGWIVTFRQKSVNAKFRI